MRKTFDVPHICIYKSECFTRFRHTLFWNVSKFKNLVKSITLKHVNFSDYFIRQKYQFEIVY